MARFVKHVTENGSEVEPKEVIEKAWRVRNDSVISWPSDVQLIQVGGETVTFFTSEGDDEPLATATEERAVPVRGAMAPCQEQDIRITVVAPEEPGFYQLFFRFREASGKKFGQRLELSFTVAAPSSSSSDSCDDFQAKSVAASRDKPLAKTLRKPKVKQLQRKQSQLQKKASMIRSRLKKVEAKLAKVNCRLQRLTSGDPGKCGNDFAVAQPINPSGGASEVPVCSPVEDAVLVSYPALEASAFEWSKELDLLNEMGFTNRAKNYRLLQKFNGNIERVVARNVKQEGNEMNGRQKKP